MPKYNLIVIGGGPAGLMAAGIAASHGAQTLLLEKMNRPGRKLLLTGNGRCNLTNVAPLEEFLQHFDQNGRFLRQAFSRFFTDELIAFFAEQGVNTVVERGGRVFPVRNDAQEVVEALANWIQKLGVSLLTRTKVEAVTVKSGQVTGVSISRTTPPTAGQNRKIVSSPQHVHAERVILATGGASYPGTGSTGDGFRLAESVGHTIIPIRPALVPLETAGSIAPRLNGLSLKNVQAHILIDGQVRAQAFGEMLFTHFGLSGPIILTLSRIAVDALHQGQSVAVSIDLKPALDEAQLDARLLRDLDTHGKRQYETILKDLLPRKLIPVCIDLTEIPAEKLAHQITSEERKRLRQWLKDFRLTVSKHRSFREAIITAGGVNLKEVDPRTMASRLVEGLYFAGEVLDLDANTGGYNLQAAFSTGWLAGTSAAVSLSS